MFQGRVEQIGSALVFDAAHVSWTINGRPSATTQKWPAPPSQSSYILFEMTDWSAPVSWNTATL